MIVMLVMIGVALNFPYVQPALLPILLGGFVFILAGVQLWKELSGKEKPEAKKEVQTQEGEQPPVAKGVSLGMFSFWMAIFPLAILLLGHLIAVPAFILSFVRWRGRSWPVSIVFAAVMTAFLYGLFTLAMRVQLYPGLIFQAMGRL